MLFKGSLQQCKRFMYLYSVCLEMNSVFLKYEVTQSGANRYFPTQGNNPCGRFQLKTFHSISQPTNFSLIFCTSKRASAI